MRLRRTTFFVAIAGLVAIGALVTGAWAMSRGDSSEPESISDELDSVLGEAVRSGEIIALSPAEIQASILADAVITLEEHNGAMERAARCIEAQGLIVHRLPGKGVGGGLQLEIEGELRTTSDDEATAIHMGCYDQHMGELNMPWAEQNRPTASEQAASAKAFDACAVANGEPQLATKDGAWVSPATLTAGSRAFWVYFGCLEHGAGWRIE
ncbi:MAG: hypothetical protein IT303_18270 [Dehalococcoidia bacterium]|nr:hypothetical protein [Dehalococcoidia bacterium]